MASSTNPKTLPKQSVTSHALRVRQEIYDRYSVPRLDYGTWVLDRLQWQGDEHILDVGCGPGDYYHRIRQKWPGIHYYGLDTSADMLEQHPAPYGLALGFAENLPYADGVFDVVMANHMLFLLDDPNSALDEFQRVLKPNGLLIAATNSLQTMPEIQALMRRALVLLGATGKGQLQPPLMPHHAFALENGTRILAQHFFAVVRYDLPTQLVFPALDPIMAYLESTRELREPYLPPEIAWDDLMMVMREQIVALLNHFGELVISKVSGVLIASNSGGFIHEFVDMSSDGNNQK
jgi:SAM-dependent methyltransferase